MKSLVTATLNENAERDLADEVLARIEERENEVRAEVMTARGELRRLRLLASMADALLRPAPSAGARRTACAPRSSVAHRPGTVHV
jgi:hypothetical protein